MVYVNARFLTQKTTGTQRFAIEICRELMKIYPTITFVAPHNILHENLAIEFNVKTFGTLKGHLWEQIELPFFLRKHKSPLLINLCNLAPLFYKYQIISVLDMSFAIQPNWFTLPIRIYYNFLIPRIVKRSLMIITISTNSKKDIVNFTKVSSEKIKIIYCGLPAIFSNLAHDEIETSGKKGNYILAVSSLDPRKNFERLIESFTSLQYHDIELKIVGSKNKIFNSENLDSLLTSSSKIKFTGFVTDAELINLYKNARLFIYPSLYEGFGIPPLEAMACGCPTIVSKTASLSEVCGNASYYLDPYSVDSIAIAIDTLLNNNDLQVDLREKGFEQVKKYRWDRSAEQLLNIIEECTKR